MTGARAAVAGTASTPRKEIAKVANGKHWEMVKPTLRRHLTQSHDDLNQRKDHKTEDVSMIWYSCCCFWNKCWPWREFKWPIFSCWRSVCVVKGKHSHTTPALLLPLRYGALEEKHCYDAKKLCCCELPFTKHPFILICRAEKVTTYRSKQPSISVHGQISVCANSLDDHLPNWGRLELELY